MSNKGAELPYTWSVNPAESQNCDSAGFLVYGIALTAMTKSLEWLDAAETFIYADMKFLLQNLKQEGD